MNLFIGSYLVPGDLVNIVDIKSAYYEKTGTVVEYGNTGGWYVLHDDGRTVYHPWGLDKVPQREPR